MKIELEIPEHLIVNLENRLAQKLNQILEERVKMIHARSVKLTRAEASKRLRISLPTIDKHVKEGLLKAERAGRIILFDEAEVNRFINQR